MEVCGCYLRRDVDLLDVGWIDRLDLRKLSEILSHLVNDLLEILFQGSRIIFSFLGYGKLEITLES